MGDTVGLSEGAPETEDPNVGKIDGLREGTIESVTFTVGESVNISVGASEGLQDGVPGVEVLTVGDPEGTLESLPASVGWLEGLSDGARDTVAGRVGEFVVSWVGTVVGKLLGIADWGVLGVGELLGMVGMFEGEGVDISTEHGPFRSTQNSGQDSAVEIGRKSEYFSQSEQRATGTISSRK